MSFDLLLAVLAAVVVGTAASAWIWLALRPRDEAEAGLAALSGMRWREFSRFVLDAMRHRGHDVDADPVALAGARQTEFVMRRDGRKWLLACRHGEHTGTDLRTVHALENALLANGAAGGILVSTGTVEADARRALAAQPKLELVEGYALWRELAPMLPETLRDEAALAARRMALNRVRVAWIGAVLVGGAVLFLAGRAYEPETPGASPAPVAAPVDQAPVPADATPASVDAPAPAAATPSVPVPMPATPDPGEEAFDRSQVALAVSALAGIESAAWISESTLRVDLRGNADERLPEICAILEQYELLRASRLQLQPPPGSDQAVRFRQCHAF